MGRGGIPDRWLEYYPLGAQVAGTRFIAFKVPLKEALCRGLSPHDYFTPRSLLEKVPQLSLVVDLTNTTRYYSSHDLESQGVQYQKVLCPGHVIPPKHLVKRFYSIVDNHINENPDPGSLIGVHCTHGLNRTSFFICSYMIERMGMVPQVALTAFQNARGYSVERENYIEELLTLKPFSASPRQQVPHAIQQSRNNKNHLPHGFQPQINFQRDTKTFRRRGPSYNDAPEHHYGYDQKKQNAQVPHAIQQSSNNKNHLPHGFQPQINFQRDTTTFRRRGPSHNDAPEHHYGYDQKKQNPPRYQDWNTNGGRRPQAFADAPRAVEQYQEMEASNRSVLRWSKNRDNVVLPGKACNSFGSGDDEAPGFHDFAGQHTAAVNKYKDFGNKSWVLKNGQFRNECKNSRCYNKDNSQTMSATKNQGIANSQRDATQARKFYPKMSMAHKVDCKLSTLDSTAQFYSDNPA